MSVSVTCTSNLTVVETLADSDLAAANSSLRHTGNNTEATYDSTTTPPATKVASSTKAMSGGAATIDLTSVTGTNGVAVDGTGLRVQQVKFINPSTNANNITVGKGASNGYDGFGSTFAITLKPGAHVLIHTVDGGTDIGAANKNLDLSGTTTQSLTYEFVLG